MPRRFQASLSNYLEYTPGLVTAAPATFHVRFCADDATTAGTLFSIADSSGANYFTLMCSGSTAGRAYVETGGGSNAQTTTSYQGRKWHSATAAWTAAATATVYLDGGGAANMTGGLTQTGINKLDVAVLNTGGLFSKYSGLIDLVAVYNVSLSVVQIARLAAGFDPWLVQGESIVGLWRLNGQDQIRELGEFGGRHLAAVAKPLPVHQSLGPPITIAQPFRSTTSPARRKWYLSAAGAAAAPCGWCPIAPETAAGRPALLPY